MQSYLEIYNGFSAFIMFWSRAVKWLQSAQQFRANVRQKEQFVGVKGMSENVQVVHGLLKDEILHLDMRLGIIRYLFYFVHQADGGNKGKGREGGWLIRGWRLIRENTSLSSQHRLSNSDAKDVRKLIHWHNIIEILKIRR